MNEPSGKARSRRVLVSGRSKGQRIISRLAIIHRQIVEVTARSGSIALRLRAKRGRPLPEYQENAARRPPDNTRGEQSGEAPFGRLTDSGTRVLTNSRRPTDPAPLCSRFSEIQPRINREPRPRPTCPASVI